MKLGKYYIIALVVILLDQGTKLLVYYNMEMHSPGQVALIGDWLKIHYILNPGMAFGAKWDFAYGKLALSLFRIVAIGGIIYYISRFFKQQYTNGLLICMALILGGAIGNGIDGTFYGVFLDGNVIPDSSTAWFHGQVIDMIYVDICDCHIPHWVPEFLGGGTYLNLWPIFNVADASIFVSVGVLLIWQKKLLVKPEEVGAEKKENSETESTEASS